MSRFGNNSSPHPVVRPEPFAGREQLIAQFKAYALADDLTEGLVALTKGFPLHLGMAGDIVAECLAASREPLTFEAFQETI